jgi:predicted O-linked N-acetylglucosamine transferase (SPINDLY family)
LEEAIAHFDRLLQVNPDYPFALGVRFHLQTRLCDWSNFERTRQRIIAGVGDARLVDAPFSFLALSDSAALQRQCAELYMRERFPPAPNVQRRQVYDHGEKIRVAYVSGDLRDHPVSRLMVGVFEHHDRARFQITAISLRPEEGSIFGQRVKSAFERYLDVSARSDAEICQLMRTLEIDIAVDLMGYTDGQRTRIFADRSVAVQVNFLGYPGTLGAPYVDYIIADEVVIPAGEERCYAEQVVRLPHCYLPTDDRRMASDVPTRSEAGLPEHGMVFCAFTGGHKINPQMFDLWCGLLRAVPGSVLWLRTGDHTMRANLSREAGDRGVPGDRLIFAEQEPSMERHMGRQRLADLYLDTLPYNAHSTACDALCAGVPVLTCAGQSFAGRVAASALRAAGLEELVTHSLDEYESVALELARSPQRLSALKAKLAAHRAAMPLFDTARYCRNLEIAYIRMHARSRQGAAPMSFAVADGQT